MTFFYFICFEDKKYVCFSLLFYREEPTKTDVDVVNALLNINVDENLYPHVFEWKLAVLQHSVEERSK